MNVSRCMRCTSIINKEHAIHPSAPPLSLVRAIMHQNSELRTIVSATGSPLTDQQLHTVTRNVISIHPSILSTQSHPKKIAGSINILAEGSGMSARMLETKREVSKCRGQNVYLPHPRMLIAAANTTSTCYLLVRVRDECGKQGE